MVFIPVQLKLRNPHSVMAALRVRPKDVARITVSPKSMEGGAWAEVIRVARNLGVNCGAQGRGEGRSEALVNACPSVELEALWPKASISDGDLWIAIDSIQDPQNLGAIFRSAAFFGVRGIIVPRERTSALTETVLDVASGGVEQVPHAQVVNLRRALEDAKKQGIWILGSSEHAETDIASVSPDRPRVLVLGNEEDGIRTLIQETCDEMVTIPAAPRAREREATVTSLNVSAAAAVLMAALSKKS